MNLNKAFVLGNLTRDPERKMLPSGQPVCNFGIATNRFYTSNDGQKQQDVEFHNIVAFGKLAETASQYLKKGSMALIEGRLRTRNWDDAAGVKHFKTEIVAERLQLGPRAVRTEGFGPSETSPPRYGATKPTLAQEEIPIIDETEGPTAPEPPATQPSPPQGETPPVENDLPKDKPLKEGFFEESAEEIDVKDIPF